MARKNAIIDIDNTLVNYVRNLYNISKKERSDIPKLSDWSWDTIYDIFGRSKGQHLVNLAVDFTNRKSPAFPTASELTNYLKSKKIEIRIVTNREKFFYDQTKDWLIKNNIYFDELIFTETNKSAFVDENTIFVFDDSPNVIKACISLTNVFSIEFNWNKDLESIKVKRPIEILYALNVLKISL